MLKPARRAITPSTTNTNKKLVRYTLPNNFANQGATLRGFENSAYAGHSVSGAGDVNGDGFADFIVGAPYTDAGGTNRGEAYVVFGQGREQPFTTPEEARKWVDGITAKGADGVKFFGYRPDIIIGHHGWGELLTRYRISALFLTSALFGLVARAEPSAFASVTTLLVGGDTMDPAVVRRVLESALKVGDVLGLRQ